MKKNLLISLLFILSNISFAQIYSADFASLNGNEFTVNLQNLSGSTVDSKITISNLFRGDGLMGTPIAGAFSSVGFYTGYDPYDYIEFSISPVGSNTYSISHITLRVTSSIFGPNAAQLYTNVLGYMGFNSVLNFSRGTTSTITLYVNAENRIGTTILRIYFHGASSPEESLGIGGGSGQDLVVYGSTALPVELTSFTSTSISNAITLNWATATEVENYGFEVERSADNTTFTKVGFVAGAGNSNVQKQYSFVDENLVAGTYYYRLKQVDTDGSFEYSQVVSSSVSETPATFSLDQNYPNPFNPSTKISFALAKDSDVKLTVFNTLGEEVAVLVNSTLTAGNHSVDFNATNLTSGMYLYKIQAGSFVATKKMVLTK